MLFLLGGNGRSRFRQYVRVHVVHELIEDALRELADEAYQTRLWTAATGPEISSFTECVCRLFNDSGLEVELDRGREVYSPDIDQALRDLGRLLSRVDQLRSPEAVLRDPLVGQARSRARSVLGQLNDLRYGM